MSFFFHSPTSPSHIPPKIEKAHSASLFAILFPKSFAVSISVNIVKTTVISPFSKLDIFRNRSCHISSFTCSCFTYGQKCCFIKFPHNNLNLIINIVNGNNPSTPSIFCYIYLKRLTAQTED